MKNIYLINDKKFKSINISLNFTMEVQKKDISKNAVLASILRKSNMKYNSHKDIENYLDELYGTTFNVNVEKFGDLYNIEFKIECVNDKCLGENSGILIKSLKFLNDIIYYPSFRGSNIIDNELLAREKQYIIEKIREIMDDKRQNAISRSFELMYPNSPFGSLVYGNEEEISKLSSNDIVSQYNNMINNSKITMILTGDLTNYENLENEIEVIFESNLDKSRDIDILRVNADNDVKSIEDNTVNEIIEEQDIYQSSLTFLIKNNSNEDDYLKAILYNSILGSTPSSKLFQNFRERESLAYTVVSQYYRYKKIFLIYAGIQKENFTRAKEVITEQLADILANNISDVEFLAAKKNLISDIKNWKDSKIGLSRLMLTNVLVGKDPIIDIDNIIKKLDGYTREDVISVAKNLEVKQIYLLGGKQDV